MGVIERKVCEYKVPSLNDSGTLTPLSSFGETSSEAEYEILGDNCSRTVVKKLEFVQKFDRKRLGVRKARRARNNLLLETLVEDTEEDGDLMERHESVFSQINKTFHNSQIWAYFIMTTEEEQREYLEKVSKKNPSLGVSFTQNNSKTEDCPHMNASPETRYGFISSHPRTILKNKRAPLETIESLETDITAVFTKDPRAVYVSPEMSSFHRLILHGLCQYNLLDTCAALVGGSRRVKITNQYTEFVLPKITLHSFLRNRLK